MRILVTGVRGQLGRALERAAAAGGHELHGVDLPELDLRDASAVMAAVAASRAHVIVNCAAFTAVDAAEQRETEAQAVNAAAVATLATAASAIDALLVQLSTDYVFDGRQQRPYREDDPPAPLSAYGRTKLAGEQAARTATRHLIVRTAWLYGEGASFVAAIRRQIEAGSTLLRVVDDQIGSPTWTEDLAPAILELAAAGAMGVVHAVNEGRTTWFGFAREIVRVLGADVEVAPMTTAQAARPAPRPACAVLDTSRLQQMLGRRLPPWQDALQRYLGSLHRESASHLESST